MEMEDFDIWSVTQEDIRIVKRIRDCRYMKAEMTTRHLGISTSAMKNCRCGDGLLTLYSYLRPMIISKEIVLLG